MTSLLSPRLAAQPNPTVMGGIYSHFFVHESSPGIRILLIVVLAVLAHGAARLLRRTSEWLLVQSHGQKARFGGVTQKPKFDTVTRLIVSGIVFVIYFLAIGLILQEFGFSLTDLPGERLRARPGDQLRLPGTGPGHRDRADADLLGRHGRK